MSRLGYFCCKDLQQLFIMGFISFNQGQYWLEVLPNATIVGCEELVAYEVCEECMVEMFCHAFMLFPFKKLFS